MAETAGLGREGPVSEFFFLFLDLIAQVVESELGLDLGDADVFIFSDDVINIVEGVVVARVFDVLAELIFLDGAYLILDLWILGVTAEIHGLDDT